MRSLLALCLLPCLTVPLLQGQPAPKGPAPEPYLAFLDLPQLESLSSVALAPDGKTVALGAKVSWRKNEITLWDLETGALRRILTGHNTSQDFVLPLAFAPDGKTLASASGFARRPGEVILWDMATGRVKHRLTVGEHYAETLAFAPDGKTLGVFTKDDPVVRFYDPATGRLQREMDLRRDKQRQTLLPQLAFSRDFKLLAGESDYSFSAKKKVRRAVVVWDLATGAVKQVMQSPLNGIGGLTFSPDGSTLAVRGHHHTEGIDLWDVPSGKRLHRLDGLKEHSKEIRFSPDGKTLVQASGDGSIARWDVATGKPLPPLKGQTKYAIRVAFAPDGKSLVSVGYDQSACVVDVATGSEKARLAAGWPSVPQVAFTRDGKTLVTRHETAAGSEIRLWDARTGAMRHLLDGRRLPPSGLFLPADGKTLWTVGNDKNLRSWDLTTGKQGPAPELPRPDGTKPWRLSPDGKLLAVGEELIDTQTGKPVPRVRLPGGAFAFAPGGRLLAILAGKEVSLLEITTGKVVKTLRPAEGRKGLLAERIDGVQFSPDGRLLLVQVTGGLGAMVPTVRGEVWEVATGKHLGTPARFTQSLHSLTFSPDGTLLAAGHGAYPKDQTFTLWSVTKEGEKKTLAAGGDLGLTVAFAPDGKTAATGTRGPQVRLWDVASGKLRATLLPLTPGQHGTPSTEWLAWTPDGYYAGSAAVPRFLQWRVGQEVLPAERFEKERRRPDLVERALTGARAE
ncbi:MAG: WD40 repeat domain-containing protein [Gemmataceae bacterium]|nr:WD40 repeat domain-containing protein [Gemmataceae bacterium]